MRVLLLSPLPGYDPACGDVTYTESLLEHPPPGVHYDTYVDAFEKATLRELGTRRHVKHSLRSRDRSCRAAGLTAVAAVINRLRREHWLFWEPFRFFQVKPGAYDAVHLNVFNAGFFDLCCPLVVSNAGPARSLYTGARRYSACRVRVLESIDMWLA